MGRSQRQQVRAICRPVPVREDSALRRVVYETLLVLAAITLWVMLFASFAAIGGCSRSGRIAAAQPDGTAGEWHCAQAIVYADMPRGSLLFVPEPETIPVPAEEFVRADWPVTPNFYDYGQTTGYQEFWYDSQGIGPWNIDHGYRLFIIQRTGQAAKP